MLMGKRPRPHMKRTTSLKEFSFDLNDAAAATHDDANPVVQNSSRVNTTTFAETASFLRSCSLCKRKLVPCRDIYMYRGNSAYCSQECREQQMKHDERKDKRCSISSSSKKAATSKNTSDQVSVNGNTVAAAV